MTDYKSARWSPEELAAFKEMRRRMAENKQSEDQRIERVKVAKACGGSLFRPPWGMGSDTLVSNFGRGEQVTLDWKRRALVMEDQRTKQRVFIPFERLDYAELLSEDEYKASMQASAP